MCVWSLQVLSAAATSSSSGSHGRSSSTQQALKVLLREALLASNAANCVSMQQRLLGLAGTAGCSSDDERLWLQLLRCKLQLAASSKCKDSSSSSSSSEEPQEAVAAHLTLLKKYGAFALPNSSSRSTCSSAALAAAYLSLGQLLSPEAASSLHAVQEVNWQAVAHSSWLQLSPGQQHALHTAHPLGVGCTPVTVSQCAAAVDAVPAGYVPAAACCAAAVAAAPAAAEPWKAYGDLLYSLASQLEQQQQQQRGHGQVLAAAAEAYCNYLASAVNAKALATPEQGLSVLLRLLETILQHGDALQPQLQQALGSCPAAAWQVLTPQLLGQLQHSSAAVRSLVQQLLQGLALVVPCSVLYPLIVEVRAAQEAGQEVGAAGSCHLLERLLDAMHLTDICMAVVAAVYFRQLH
jgi:hypothetical protein